MLMLKGYVVDIPKGDEPFQISIFRVDNDKPGGRGDTVTQDRLHPNSQKTGIHFDLPLIGGEYGFEISGPCTLVPKYAAVQGEQK